MSILLAEHEWTYDDGNNMTDQTTEPSNTEGGSDKPSTTENFAELLDESYGTTQDLEGTVVPGTIIAIENDMAVVDVGLKSEGRISLKEFSGPGQTNNLQIGDKVEVFLERMESVTGEAVLSRDKARREEAWGKLEKAFSSSDRVDGVIFGRVKGGFTVDLSGAVAFLPGSQVDVRPVRDVGPLMGKSEPFQILKMDRRRGNIVVSRRAVLEEDRAEARAEIVSNLAEGQVLDGVVKNITDYGAFVDLGGIDGLLHVTDIAWRRTNHPSEVLSIGQTVKVQVVRVNPDTQRISLGMKQLGADPWESVDSKYPVDSNYTGRVTNITDYGAFVELEPGVEGLVHVSEMSWTKKNVHPGKIVSTSQQVDVKVLDVDPVKRRISLGLKQCIDNPWESFLASHPTGDVVEGQIRSITEFGLFVGLDGDVDGMIHLSDLSWDQPGEKVAAEYKKGDTVRAKVLEVSVERERIGLGIKQLSDDPFANAVNLKKGETVTCTVSGVKDSGLEVTVSEGVTGFIRRADLARERSEQRPDRFAAGDRFDARITNVDHDARQVSLSIKVLEIAEEKEAMAQYGSSDSGASLGDILGAAISRHAEEKTEVPSDDIEPSTKQTVRDKSSEEPEQEIENTHDNNAEISANASAGSNDENSESTDDIDKAN